MRNFLWLIGLLGLMFFASCVPNKKLIYLQDLSKDKNDSTKEYVLERTEYKLQVSDVISIEVKATDPKLNAFFASTSGSTNSAQVATSGGDVYYMFGYQVDPRGDVDVPLIGKLKIVGKTISETKSEIETKLKEYLINFHVTVRMGGLRYTMLGEVRRPGKFVVLQNQLTIFEAIANAGDLTDFAKRTEVLIIRQYPEGVKLHTINLLDKNILKSPFYFIQTSDQIYFPPLKARMLTGTLGLQYLQIISTALTAIALIINFSK